MAQYNSLGNNIGSMLPFLHFGRSVGLKSAGGSTGNRTQAKNSESEHSTNEPHCFLTKVLKMGASFEAFLKRFF